MKVKNFAQTIKWYDEHVEDYINASFKKASVDLIDQFMKLLPIHPKILDAGCGHGRDSNILYSKGADVVGLDISKGLLDYAKVHYPQVKFIQGSFLEMPFDNATFDGIWAYSSLVHLDDEHDVKRSLKEFYRVLKKDGVLHVYVKEKSEFHIQEFAADKERYFRYFTQSEIKKYIIESGFTILKMTTRQSTTRKGLHWISIFAGK